MVIIWINGPFGVGKTTVTSCILQENPSLALFDTEYVGFMLRHALEARRPVADFQDWVPWRRLVVATLAELSAELECDIVVPQTVLVERYWLEIVSGLLEHGVVLRAFTLDAAPEEHERRIANDQVLAEAAGWRRERLPDFAAALPWLRRRTTVIDTTASSPQEVAGIILRRASASE